MRKAKTTDNYEGNNYFIAPDLVGFICDLEEREWIKDAACRGMDTNIFFPEKNGGQQSIIAKSICKECKVRADCYEYGKDEDYGIWGGEGYTARKKNKVSHG